MVWSVVQADFTMRLHKRTFCVCCLEEICAVILIDLLSGSLMLEEGMDSKDGKDGEYGNVDGPQGGRFALSRSPDWTVPP